MSTRGVYTFIEGSDKYHVYKHSDNYPSGAAEAIVAALDDAWALPRFEADEFAAAFVSANKPYYKNQIYAELTSAKPNLEEIARCEEYRKKYDGGGVRLLKTGSVKTVSPCDIEYRYEIRCTKGALHVTAYSTHYWDKKTESKLFDGTVADFVKWANKFDK